jgi:hypothetical protein
MRVKITFINGGTMFGKLNIAPTSTLGDILNDGVKFITFIQPNDREVYLNKASIAYIVEDSDEL